MENKEKKPKNTYTIAFKLFVIFAAIAAGVSLHEGSVGTVEKTHLFFTQPTTHNP